MDNMIFVPVVYMWVVTAVMAILCFIWASNTWIDAIVKTVLFLIAGFSLSLVI